MKASKTASSSAVANHVRKQNSKSVSGFNYATLYEGEQQLPCKRIASNSGALNSKSLETASAAVLGSLDSERISNPRAFENSFTVQTSSKFGNLKKKSQVKDRCSNMQQDAGILSEAKIRLTDGIELICKFQ